MAVNPIFLEFAPARGTATVEVTNYGPPTTVQVRLFGWAQQGDEDRLSPTADLMASPPIFDIATDQIQVVRLMLRRPADATERPYRLLVDEIPPAGQARQVVMALRFSIPVIIAGTAPASAEVIWRAERGAGSQVVLIGQNTGRRHIRVNQLEVSPAGAGRPLVARSVGSNPFLLAGAERRFRLDLSGGAARGGSALRLRMLTSGGEPVEQVVTLPS
jgi:fimbrial chaperone protein